MLQKPVLQKVAALQGGCAQFGVRLAEAAFQFPLMHPAVVSAIPGGQSVAEMDSTLLAARAEVPQGLWAALLARGPFTGGVGVWGEPGASGGDIFTERIGGTVSLE